MKPFVNLLLSAFLLSACQEMEAIDMSQLTDKEKRAVESLLWLQDSDATTNAAEALEKGDKRLIAMASRATVLPGIETDMISKAKSICGIRYLEGSTDTVFGETHLKLIQAASEYAEAYNRIVIEQCIKQ